MIRLFLLIALIFIPMHSRAIEITALKTGDVLLQSVPCYVCALIELEEGSPYSHAGIILKEDQQVFALESWGRVEKLPLTTHLSYRKKNTPTLVLRPIDQNGNEILLETQSVSRLFDDEFLGLSYDDRFLWDNQDTKGEKYYCSEFVAKFLNRLLPVAITPKPMHFNQYRSDWIKYFRGLPPDGKPGISPGDFANSPLFKSLGNLEN